MADKGWGSKTSSEKNYYKLLKDSVMNVIDTKRTGGHYSSQWTKNNNSKNGKENNLSKKNYICNG